MVGAPMDATDIINPGKTIVTILSYRIQRDKATTDDDKPKLQEAMSEQMISINKANLHVNLKVIAGVLATVNPEKGHFIEGIPYNKQFIAGI